MLVIRRTSEHWWEDEQEFDALTEMVLPKRLHVAVVSESEGAPLSAAAGGWDLVSEEGTAVLSASAGGTFSSGFTSNKSRVSADALWSRLRQDGPPFFKKVRTRAALDVLEDPAASPEQVAAASEDLWSELCGQTWRVELDYGLAGSEAQPRDQLLVACSGLAAQRLLQHAELEADEVTRRVGVALADVAGYSAAAVGSEGSDAGRHSWRVLKPKLQAQPGVAGASAGAAIA